MQAEKAAHQKKCTHRETHIRTSTINTKHVWFKVACPRSRKPSRRTHPIHPSSPLFQDGLGSRSKSLLSGQFGGRSNKSTTAPVKLDISQPGSSQVGSVVCPYLTHYGCPIIGSSLPLTSLSIASSTCGLPVTCAVMILINLSGHRSTLQLLLVGNPPCNGLRPTAQNVVNVHELCHGVWSTHIIF